MHNMTDEEKMKEMDNMLMKIREMKKMDPAMMNKIHDMMKMMEGEKISPEMMEKGKEMMKMMEGMEGVDPMMLEQMKTKMGSMEEEKWQE